MGVLNVTPDSFSDGGRFFDAAAAIEHARRMVAEGADILDVGAESTRPYGGATAVSYEEEMRRLEPVLPAILELGVPVSIDTMKAKVAAAALAAGAAIVNDVWGLQRDPDMARVVAEHAAPVLVMHNRETADAAIDIMADIRAFFVRSLAIADSAGIARRQHRARSGHRLRQDAGAEPHRPCTLRGAEIVRTAADDRRLAQTLHRQGLARPA